VLGQIANGRGDKEHRPTVGRDGHCDLAIGPEETGAGEEYLKRGVPVSFGQ